MLLNFLPLDGQGRHHKNKPTMSSENVVIRVLSDLTQAGTQLCLIR